MWSHHRTLRPASGVDIPGGVYGWLQVSFFLKKREKHSKVRVCGFIPAQSIGKYSCQSASTGLFKSAPYHQKEKYNGKRDLVVTYVPNIIIYLTFKLPFSPDRNRLELQLLAGTVRTRISTEYPHKVPAGRRNLSLKLRVRTTQTFREPTTPAATSNYTRVSNDLTLI